MLKALGQGRFGDLSSLVTKRVPLQEFVENEIKALIYEKDQPGMSALQWMNQENALLLTILPVKILLHP